MKPMPLVRACLALLLLGSAPLPAQSARQIDSLFAAGDSPGLERAIAMALKAAPGDALLHARVQTIRLEQRRYGEAVAAGRRVLELAAPGLAGLRAWAGVRSGTAAFMLGDTTGAREALRAAAALAASGRPARVASELLRLLALDSLYGGWTVVESEHFRLHLPPESNVGNPAAWAAEREAALAEMQRFFQASLPKKIDVIVWDGRMSAAEAGFPNLGFANPALAVVHTLPTQTPGHEPAHVVAYWAGGAPPDSLRTRLVSEGTSVAFDGAHDDHLADARRGVEGTGFPPVVVARIWNDRGAVPEAVMYPTAALVVQRLIQRGGRDRFLALLRDQRLENARAIYGSLLDEVMASVEKDVNGS